MIVSPLDSDELILHVDTARIFLAEEEEEEEEEEANIVVSLRDITERNRIEEELAASEKKYKYLVENAVVGVYRSNLRGNILYANKAFADIFEFESPEELMAVDPDKIGVDTLALYKNPSDRYRLIKKLIETGIVPNQEIEMKTKYGKTKAVLLSESLDGDIISGMLKDITEMRTLERQLIQAQKLESLGTLAGGIAHDFNNILSIILGYADLLERAKLDPEKISQSIDAITKATQRGASLVKQFLTFARKTETIFESVHLNDIITEIENIMQETFPKTIVVSTELQKDLPAITADATQIHQALLNLSVNARDAMPKGGTLSISTKTVSGETLSLRHPKAEAREYVGVQVSDTGTGMDEATLQKIFEPFFTTKEIGKGTGLGLALVYGIVENHNGFLDVISELGKGTTFHVYLPVQEQTLEGFELSKVAEQDIPGGTETVLFIEDEEMLREIVKSTLISKGYTVITAQDGEEGVEAFSRHQKEISVVVTDMGLPKFGGEEVFRKIRAINPKAKVILISGFIDPHVKSELYKAGVKLFIQKPYMPYEVLINVRDVIDAGE
ncbi:MAG: response regulator [Bacteroidetes bacterium]|nr:response regulator [Bacteroidota bacterium]